MQRKMKLIRKLLEYVESDHEGGPLPVPEIDGYSDAQVHFHVGLCDEAGFLVVGQAGMYPEGRRYSSIVRITWAGYEALDAMRARSSE